jgi:prephenate dehydratase
MSGKIAYQGEPGANSNIACAEARPDLEPLPCRTFEDAFDAVKNGDAVQAMIPVENSIAGRVADIHHLLPDSGLHIIDEHFLPIRFHLMAKKGVELGAVKKAYSHVMGLGQCGKFLKQHKIEAVTSADTAGAAREVSEADDMSIAAIAPKMAASVYGLEILASNIEDHAHNTTRFVIMAPEPIDNGRTSPDEKFITSFVFKVRNVPAALYKVMGGFATNGVNMTKLESYMVEGSFTATMFYAEVEGHPDDRNVQLALEEMGFFSTRLDILGVFHAHEYRKTGVHTS